MSTDCYSISFGRENAHFPFRQSTYKAFIHSVLHELSAKTGTHADKLPVHFVQNKNYIACFYYGGKGNGFNVNTDFLPSLTPRQLREVIIHEFAHYLRNERFGPTKEKDGHDAKWVAICKELGIAGDRYHKMHVTQVFDK